MRIDADRLRGFLDCMHEEADARDKRSEAIRDIVKAAKDAGYDTKAVRKVFVRERMDEAERAKQDDLLETYEAALGGKGRALRAIEAGAPVGQAAAENGVHRATVARARHVAKQPSNATEPAHAGEIKTGEVASSGGDAGHRSEPSRPAEQSVNPGPLPERVSLSSKAGKDGTPALSTAGDAQGDDDGCASVSNGHECVEQAPRAADRDGEPVDDAGRQPPPAARHAGGNRASAGQLLAAAAAASGKAGGGSAGADAGHAGGSPAHGRDDGAGLVAPGRDLHAAARPAVAPEPEVARAAPPATEPVDWDAINATWPAGLRRVSA